MNRSDLLRTGQVADLLGCSRQHVVDLCDEGKLEHQTTGVHRRIPRHAVDGYRQRTAPRREDLRSLWLSRAVVGKLVEDPGRVMAISRRNLQRLQNIHAGSSTLQWIEEWRRLVDAGSESVMQVLTADTPYARDLRQNSPFAGVLSRDERERVLDSFRSQWDHKAA